MNTPSINPSTELVPTFTANIGGTQTLTVNARELHGFLQVGRVFAAWIAERVEKYGFIDGQDFVVFSESGKNPKGGRPTVEYHISIDMAKELAMVENNAQGRRIRRYFIECERRLRGPVRPLYLTPDQVNQIRLAVRDRINNTGENHATVYNELFRSLGACSTNGILQAQFNHAIHQVNSYRRPARPEELVQDVIERSRFIVQHVDGKPRVSLVPDDCWIVTAENLPELLRTPGALPLDILPEVIRAAAERLGGKR